MQTADDQGIFASKPVIISGSNAWQWSFETMMGCLSKWQSKEENEWKLLKTHFNAPTGREWPSIIADYPDYRPITLFKKYSTFCPYRRWWLCICSSGLIASKFIFRSSANRYTYSIVVVMLWWPRILERWTTLPPAWRYILAKVCRNKWSELFLTPRLLLYFWISWVRPFSSICSPKALQIR